MHIVLEGSAFLNYRGRGSHSHGVSYTTGAGYGRVEIMNEVEIAERLLEKVNKFNNSNLRDDVFLLADYITELKNRREITNRGDLSEEFELLKSKLLETGYNLDAIDFESEIQKIYGKEPLILRQHGFLASLKIQRQFTAQNQVLFGQGTFSGNAESVAIQVERNKYINAKFQLNSQLSVGIQEGNNISFLREYTETSFINFSSTLHYLPNIDTRFSVGVSASVNNDIRTYFEPVIVQEFSDYNVKLNLEYEKRFKRNLRVAFGVGIGYSKFNGNGNLLIEPRISIRM